MTFTKVRREVQNIRIRLIGLVLYAVVSLCIHLASMLGDYFLGTATYLAHGDLTVMHHSTSQLSSNGKEH